MIWINQRYIYIYLNIFEEILENNGKEKKNFLNIEKTDKYLWYKLYQTILVDEQNGACQLISRFLQNKAKSKIKELT